MVRIGRWILFEKAKTNVTKVRKVSEKFKAKTKGPVLGRKVFFPGEHSWQSRCTHFDKLAQQYPLFNQACLAIAGMTVSQGVFLSPAVKKNEETYPLAEEALWRVQKFNRDMRVIAKFWETALRMVKYGAAFWEVTWTPKFAFRLAPFQECIEPAEADELGEVSRWRQVINGMVTAEWPAKPVENETYMIMVPWNVTSDTWPYGTSLGVGLETELEALIQMEQSVKDYMEKQAWPYEILALGDKDTLITEEDYRNAKTEWQNRQPGEGIVTRNMPVNLLSGGTGSNPIRELAVLCELMKDNVHDGLMVPPLSKLYNSTEASARVLAQHVMTVLGQPIQWLIKEAYEETVLKPYLESLGFSRKTCPQVLFESPDTQKKDEGEFWVGLVQAKIQTPKQASEHLGLEYDEDYWVNRKLESDKLKGEEEVYEVRRKTYRSGKGGS